MMFPSIKPTNGIKIASLNLIRFKICIKRKVPTSAKRKATVILKSWLPPGKISRETKIPNFAKSIVPAVVGETNLFLLNCCIMRPAILMLAPATRIETKRGSRETVNICHCSLEILNKSNGFILETPMKREKKDKMIKAGSKYRFFIDLRPLSTCICLTIKEAIFNISYQKFYE